VAWAFLAKRAGQLAKGESPGVDGGEEPGNNLVCRGVGWGGDGLDGCHGWGPGIGECGLGVGGYWAMRRGSSSHWRLAQRVGKMGTLSSPTATGRNSGSAWRGASRTEDISV